MSCVVSQTYSDRRLENAISNNTAIFRAGRTTIDLERGQTRSNPLALSWSGVQQVKVMVLETAGGITTASGHSGVIRLDARTVA